MRPPGAYNVLLHPGLTNFLDFDRLPVDHLHAVETYSVNAAHTWPDQAEGRYAVDALLARGHRLHVTVGDDAHWHHERDRFGAWVEVRAEADLDLAKLRSPYWRLTVTARDGTRAWTNPVWQ